MSNPFFIHYLFEALVAFVRISSSNQQLCMEIENYLTPFLQDVDIDLLILSLAS